MSDSLNSAWYQEQSRRLGELATLRTKVETLYLDWQRASNELAEKTEEYRSSLDRGIAAVPGLATAERDGKAKKNGRKSKVLEAALRALCAASCDIPALARAIGTGEAYLRNQVMPKLSERGLIVRVKPEEVGHVGYWGITEAGRAGIRVPAAIANGAKNG